jgi:putative endonuclease
MIGKIGEELAERFLVKHGFTIKARNYLKKWGEIDIIAEKDNRIHFIEVKSASYRSRSESKNASETTDHVTHETSHRPEEKVHAVKLKRLSRAIETYILENNFTDREIQIDVITVKIDSVAKRAKVDIIENVIIDQ